MGWAGNLDWGTRADDRAVRCPSPRPSPRERRGEGADTAVPLSAVREALCGGSLRDDGRGPAPGQGTPLTTPFF